MTKDKRVAALTFLLLEKASVGIILTEDITILSSSPIRDHHHLRHLITSYDYATSIRQIPNFDNNSNQSLDIQYRGIKVKFQNKRILNDSNISSALEDEIFVIEGSKKQHSKFVRSKYNFLIAMTLPLLAAKQKKEKKDSKLTAMEKFLKESKFPMLDSWKTHKPKKKQQRFYYTER